MLNLAVLNTHVLILAFFNGNQKLVQHMKHLVTVMLGIIMSTYFSANDLDR